MREGWAAAMEASGHPIDAEYQRMLNRRGRRQWEAFRAGTGPRPKGPDPDALVEGHGLMFWHTESSQPVVCACGHFGDFLCDGPVGKGRTCDALLCKCCRTVVADGIDFCPTHAALRGQFVTP